MIRSAFNKGDELVLFTGYPNEFRPDSDGWWLERTVRSSHRVKVLDKNCPVKKRVSRFSSQYKDGKGVKVEIIEPAQYANGYVAGQEVTLTTSRDLMMPWSEFEERTREAREKMLKEQEEEQRQEKLCNALEKRAQAYDVSWDGDASEPYFTIGMEGLEKLLDAAGIPKEES